MRNSPDPLVHRQRQQQLIQHVQQLLDDPRLRVDTTRGRRPVPDFGRDVSKRDRSAELKRLASQLSVSGQDLENRMPVDPAIEAVLWQRAWGLFRQTVGRIEAACISPMRALLAHESPAPLDGGAVQKLLGELSPPGRSRGVPTTLVLMSSGGFTLEAHELAERRADRTLIFVEPNDAGGWTVTGPVETKSLVDLFDPETDQAKRQRLRALIESDPAALSAAGRPADLLAAQTQLPIQWIETELRSYAADHPGLTARRMDGRVVLLREGVPPAGGGASA